MNWSYGLQFMTIHVLPGNRDEYVHVSYDDGDDSGKAKLVPHSVAIQIRDACDAPENARRRFKAWMNRDQSGTIHCDAAAAPANHASFYSLTNAHEWLWSQKATYIHHQASPASDGTI